MVNLSMSILALLNAATIGENLVVRRYAKVVTDGSLGTYVHANNKVGVIVASNASGVEDALKNISMHAVL